MKTKSLIGLAALPVVAGACADAKQEPQKPNILLIIADDLGIGDVNAYG